MRSILLPRLAEARVRMEEYENPMDLRAGAFRLTGPCARIIRIISSGVDHESGWEHVSVSTEKHIPNWTEMCFVKDLFWEEEECVMQLHPPKSMWVNIHPNCLHLWKHVYLNIPLPPNNLV